MENKYPLTQLYLKLASQECLAAAFASVKRNKGCVGIDKVDIKRFEERQARYLAELEQALLSERYQPLPSRRVYIPKANGKLRPLGIPTVRDRVAQQAVLDAIQPIFEPEFAECSYGFRPGKSAIQAVEKVQQYLNAGYAYIVEADIKDFFTALNRKRLMSKAKEILPKEEKQIIGLLWKFLNAGVMEEGMLKTAVAGTPQGGVISPLLANIYLNDFDHAMERAGFNLVRYADDFVILCQTVNQAMRAIKMVREIMASLGLELAPKKTGVIEYRRGFDFLGYRFQEFYGNRKWPSRKAIESFKDKVRRVTRRQQPKNARMVVAQLNPILRGWGNYFKHGDAKTKFTQLDSWVRMRLRSFIEKRKWPAGMNWKYPNEYLRQLGLVSLLELPACQPALSLPYNRQPYRRAGCGKSARPVR